MTSVGKCAPALTRSTLTNPVKRTLATRVIHGRGECGLALEGQVGRGRADGRGDRRVSGEERELRVCAGDRWHRFGVLGVAQLLSRSACSVYARDAGGARRSSSGP